MPATAPGGAGDPPVVQVPDLQPSLSSTQVRASEVVSGGQVVDITTSTTWEALKPWLQNQAFLDRVHANYHRCLLICLLKVKEFLPAGEEVTLSDLSPVQALSMFSKALFSGKLGPLIREFGLGDEAANAAAKGDMEEFVKALQNRNGENKDDKDKENIVPE